MDKYNWGDHRPRRTGFNPVRFLLFLVAVVLAAIGLVAAFTPLTLWRSAPPPVRPLPAPASGVNVRHLEVAEYLRRKGWRFRRPDSFDRTDAWQRAHPEEFSAMRRAARAHAYDTVLDTP